MTELYHSDIIYDIRWIQNFLKEKHKMETTEQKPLTKHIQTAVTALEKQIEKYNNQARKLKKKAYDAEMEAEEVFKAIATLTDQISKLKGE